MNKYFFAFIFLLFFGNPGFTQPLSYDPDLWLPDTIHMALGNTIELYNENVAFIRLNDTTLHFTWTYAKGSSDVRKYYWTTNQLGNVKLTLKCTYKHVIVDSASTIVKVVNKVNPGSKNLLSVGNSLTNNGFIYMFPQIISDVNFPITPFGLMGTTYKHEGHGGWMFRTFLQSTVEYTSPFYIQGKIDFKKYIENNSFPNPDIVKISLGINECKENISIDEIMGYAKQLIDTIKRDYPNSLITVAIPSLCELTGAGWIAKYYNLDNFEPYQLRIRQLWKRLYAGYSYGKYSTNIQMSWDGLFIDRKDGYPTNNGLHPNSLGYTQLIRGFSNTLNYYINKTINTNIKLERPEDAYKIYPNPVSDYFTISFLNEYPESISLYDELGQIVLSQKVNDDRVTININNLENGLYVCNMMISGKLFSQKILKI